MEIKNNKFNVKLFSILSYVGPLFIIGKCSAEKNDEDVKFHCNQGLRLFVVILILYIASEMILLLIREFLTNIYNIANIVLISVVFVCWLSMMLIGMVNSTKNQRVPLPIIGGKN